MYTVIARKYLYIEDVDWTNTLRFDHLMSTIGLDSYKIVSEHALFSTSTLFITCKAETLVSGWGHAKLRPVTIPKTIVENAQGRQPGQTPVQEMQT